MTKNILNISKLFKVSFFDFNKVRFQAMGFLIASAVFMVFYLYSEYLLSYQQPSPLITMISNIIFISGTLLTAIILLLTYAGVARMIKADLLAQSPTSRPEAKSFIKSKWASIIFAPCILLIFGAVTLLAEYLISFIGLIPVVGALILAVFTIPALIINVVLVILLIIGVQLVPAVVAIEETNPWETAKIVFRTCNEEPLKVAFFTGLLLLVGLAIFIVPIGAFLGSLLVTAKLLFNNIMVLELNYWTFLLFVFIVGGSVLITSSLVIALPLTYFQGVFTSTYLYLKSKL